MTACAFCGDPVDWTETHHHNGSKHDNDPDNLRTVCRRCHMSHHENRRATDHDAARRYGPRRPTTRPPGV